MRQEIKLILAAACAVTCICAHATDYTWANTATSAQSWYAPANWAVGGAQATEVPSNATDTATFPAIDSVQRVVNLMTKSGDASIASVSGSAAWLLRLNAYSSNSTYGDDVLNFSVKDVNGFVGEWDSTGSKKTLVLTAESGVQTLSRVSTMQQFSLKVESATATADILQLCGTAGSLRKSGPGDLRIREVVEDGNLVLELEEGNVQIDGSPKMPLAACHKDFHLVDAANATSITVPEGRVARIDTLRVKGSSFTKKGAGTLQVGRVYPEDLTITVEGGAVRLDTTVATATVSEPVGTPQFWFDADYDASVSFVKDGENVTNWRDRRNNGQQTSRLNFTQITAYPQVDTTSLPGHTVLAFPNKSAMQMPAGNQRESFVVFCYTDDITKYNVLANGYATDRKSGTASALFAYYDTAPDKMGGGIYSVDGKPVRPFESTGSTFVVGQWHVAHLSTTVAYAMDRIASNGARNATGHVKIAEIVTYTTALTPEEREKNIDYLMNKWLGKRHPAYERPTKDVSVSFTGDAEIGSDTDATFADVSGAGTLTKTGTGSATVTAVLAESFTDVAVAGGSLTIVKNAAPEDRSQFHFDAMDAASYTAGSYVDGEGETRVASWLDTRSNGVSAITKPMESNLYATNPIVRQVVCPDGVTRPIFDFLVRNGRNVDPPTAAALKVSPTPATSCEAICVFADNTKNANNVTVFGITEPNVDPFMRGLSGMLFRDTADGDTADEDVRNGYISVDGADGSPSSYVSGENNELHVVHIAPANGHKYPMGAIGYKGSTVAGGVRYGEYMAFSSPLTDKERAYYQGHLLHKWLGRGEDAIWTNELSSVSVAAGSTLVVSGGGAILAPTISGGGTISATKVMGIAEIDLTVAAGFVQQLTVDGAATFAPMVRVSLSGAGATTLREGEYTLISATSLEGVNLSGWALATSQTRPYAFVRDGSSVKLQVRAPGLFIIVR